MKEYNMDFKEIQKHKNRNILYKIIKELKENYKIPYKEITGRINVSLSTVTRLMNKKWLVFGSSLNKSKGGKNEI